MLIMEPEPSPSSGAVALPALSKPINGSAVWRTETPASFKPEPESVGSPLPLPAKAAKKPKTAVFVCTEVHCGKQFPRSFALRRHMRIHTGTKPYVCDYEGCSQRFNTSGNLSRHKRIHSGERPYPCIFSTCGKRFNTSTKLKRHMRVHFPEGQNLFRCVDIPDCHWSCDNYKEFAQHQKMHHNVVVGAQQQQQQQAQQYDAAEVAAVSVSDKDNDYFGTADTTREYSSEHSYSHHSTPATGSFLYGSSYAEKPKSSILPASRKLIGPPFFSSSPDLGSSLTTMLPKESKKSVDADHDYSSDRRKTSSFPYSSGFSLSSDSAYSRSGTGFGSNHFSLLRSDEDRDGYDQHSQHMLPPPGQVLRPPPQSNDDKYGGYTVPPPMNPAAPELTGEELNVVLQLMNENESY